MKSIKELFNKYPFAFEYLYIDISDKEKKSLISDHKIDPELFDNDKILHLKDINEIKSNNDFNKLTTQNKLDFIKDIYSNIANLAYYEEYYVLEYLDKNVLNFFYGINYLDNNNLEFEDFFEHEWKEFLKEYEELLKIENIKTQLEKLPNITQKINYLNRLQIMDCHDNFGLNSVCQYINKELHYWKEYIEEPQIKNLFDDIEWNKSKTDLSELIYVLQKSESIKKNGKNITLKDLTELFNDIFHKDIKNVSDLLNKGAGTYIRKDDYKTYIKTLNNILDKYIEEKK